MNPEDVVGVLVGVVIGMVLLGGWMSLAYKDPAPTPKLPPKAPTPPPQRFEIPQLPPRPNPADDGCEGLPIADVARRCLDGLDEASADDPDVLEALWHAPEDVEIPPFLADTAWLMRAAKQRDPTILSGFGPKQADLLDRLFAPRCPEALATWTEQTGSRPGPGLIGALAKRDPDRLRALLSRDPNLGELEQAICDTLDAKHPIGGLQDTWASAGDTNNPAWQNGELRRLSRLDLEAATPLFEQLSDAGTLDSLAEADYFAALTLQDPEQALIEAEKPGYQTDRLPRFAGCARAGADVGPALARIRAELGPNIYDPWSVFKGILAIELRRDEVAGVEATVRAGGPRGWQVASASWMHLRRRPQLLAPLRLAVEPGVVASRDVDLMGMPAGKVAMRPPWLRRRGPKPLDRLVLFADEDGIDWGG